MAGPRKEPNTTSISLDPKQKAWIHARKGKRFSGVSQAVRQALDLLIERVEREERIYAEKAEAEERRLGVDKK